MNIVILVGSVAIEFALVWWFITREYWRPKSLRRYLSWLVLMIGVFVSPFFQASMIRQIVEQRALADNIAHAWVILVSICGLTFTFTMLHKLRNKDTLLKSDLPKDSQP